MSFNIEIDESILKDFSGTFGLSAFWWKDKNDRYLNWILLYNWKDYNWDLDGGNQNYSYGETCVRTPRWINNESNFWKYRTPKVLRPGTKKNEFQVEYFSMRVNRLIEFLVDEIKPVAMEKNGFEFWCKDQYQRLSHRVFL